MSDDTLPRIAVLGAGPMGLEATLYARYLGYPVQLIERGPTAAANVLAWGHVELFTPFRLNASPLGVAALQAQDPGWQAPEAEAVLSGRELYERYLQPLAASDLVQSQFQLETEVLAVGRQDWLKSEGLGGEERSDSPFVLLLRDAAGAERTTEADIVLDCTGTFGNHNWLGQGGVPAPGESVAAAHIEYALPDVLGRDRQRYAGQHTLLVGAGYSAATVVTQLAQLPNSKVTWLTRGTSAVGPIRRIPDDRLPRRDALAAAANQLATADGPVTHSQATTVTAIEYRQASDDFEVHLAGQQQGPHRFDRIVATIGYRPDNRIFQELQVPLCHATDGPLKLASTLARNTNSASTDCLNQPSAGPQSLSNPEPNFYVLGQKSYGRHPQFLLSIGHAQIRDVFTIIGEREDLDIYATMPNGGAG